ncbi:MAG: tripartite tricarboxylate transporter substrate binding protein [Hyphomicrobiales bacterium]|nr:tripartite tricarboxylate transporter substrate binding protein [Hyphomicrobiales bacterium]
MKTEFARSRRLRTTFGPLAVLAVLVSCAWQSALAQHYPNRPVTIVTTVPAGGSIDAVARILATGLTKSLGQPVIVEPRPGAGGNLAAGYVAGAPADGHILLMGSSATLTTNPHLYKSLPFDPERSFEAIIIPARVNQILVVRPNFPAKNLQEFIALMKAQPAKYNYGSSGIGALSHLAAEIFGIQTGTRATHVPYRGIAPAITDLLAGQIDFVFDSATTIQHIQAGRLRALAVIGPRIPTIPDVQTFEELGIDGMKIANGWYAIAAPAGTPREVIRTLNAAIKEILITPASTNAIRTMGLDPATSTPEEMSELWRSEIKRLGIIIKQINLKQQ